MKQKSWNRVGPVLAILLCLSIPVLYVACGGSGDNPITGISAPTGVSVTAGEELCSIDWEAVDGSSTYKVYMGLDPGVSKNDYLKVIEDGAPPYTFSGLQAGTTFYYVVTAIGDNGESIESEVVGCTPELLADSTSPINVAATIPSETTLTIEISWSPPASGIPEGYFIYWSNAAGINPEDAATYEGKIADDASPYLHTGLEGRTLYYYVVTAVFSGVEGMESAEVSAMPRGGGGGGGGGNGGKPGGETAGNNLSFPVIWSEGVTKVLPGTAGDAPVLTGEWWYQWGTNGVDPNVTPASCLPDPDNNAYCDDGIEGQFNDLLVPGVPAADSPLPLAKAYLQKDAKNIWQAGSATPDIAGVAEVDGSLAVDWIDWGDNLESVDWYTRSQVRTEVVLFEDNPDPEFIPVPDYNPWLEYGMRHTSGWGINEAHGLEATLADEPVIGSGLQATVYSYCARLTIQKLLVARDDARLADLVWVPGQGWTEPEGYPDDLINPSIFNGSVHEGGDGPGYYSAEINVKGRIIFGYTWNVRKLNEGAGDYRITFSFDQVCGAYALNTFFVEGITQIIEPAEEEIVIAAEEPPTGGGRGVVDFSNNLTFMDISIHERGGGI